MTTPFHSTRTLPQVGHVRATSASCFATTGDDRSAAFCAVVLVLVLR